VAAGSWIEGYPPGLIPFGLPFTSQAQPVREPFRFRPLQFRNSTRRTKFSVTINFPPHERRREFSFIHHALNLACLGGGGYAGDVLTVKKRLVLGEEPNWPAEKGYLLGRAQFQPG